MLRVAPVSAEGVAAGLECAISTEPSEVGDVAATLPCGHVFHDADVRRWLAEHHTCPSCRFRLPTDIAADGADADSDDGGSSDDGSDNNGDDRGNNDVGGDGGSGDNANTARGGI